MPKADNPVGGTRLIDQAISGANAILTETERWLLNELDSIRATEITVNADKTYQYQIDLFTLQRITLELKQRLDSAREPVVSRSVSAYEAGTGTAVAHLAAISADYTRTITQVLVSDPWQRRVALVRSRVFEEMAGFSAETATDLSRVLSTGIENGQNPIEVARTIRDRFDVSKSRAERIARTEITGALRRAEWDESESAALDVGVRTRQMHLSALSPTTRESHAVRHGNLYTVQEVRDWYAKDANGINCKCAQVAVLVDEAGNPLQERVVKRAKAAKARYEERVGAE